MKVVTVATHSERYFPVLIQSCKRHGVDLTILGWGEKWQGFVWRFKKLLEFLNSVSDDELIVFIDAYDVILLQNAATIEKKFNLLINKTNAKIIIAFDNPKLSSWVEFISKYIFGNCQGKRINAGTYIGKAKDIKNLIQNACKFFDCDTNIKYNDDQILLTKYCKINPQDMFIDEGKDLFLIVKSDFLLPLNMHKNHIEIINNELVYKNIKPCFIHGVLSTNMNNIIEKLNYTNDFKLQDFMKYNIKSMLHFYHHVINSTLLIIIYIIVIIIIFLIHFKRLI